MPQSQVKTFHYNSIYIIYTICFILLHEIHVEKNTKTSNRLLSAIILSASSSVLFPLPCSIILFITYIWNTEKLKRKILYTFIESKSKSLENDLLPNDWLFSSLQRFALTFNIPFTFFSGLKTLCWIESIFRSLNTSKVLYTRSFHCPQRLTIHILAHKSSIAHLILKFLLQEAILIRQSYFDILLLHSACLKIISNNLIVYYNKQRWIRKEKERGE